jgi:hypothetical protein
MFAFAVKTRRTETNMFEMKQARKTQMFILSQLRRTHRHIAEETRDKPLNQRNKPNVNTIRLLDREQDYFAFLFLTINEHCSSSMDTRVVDRIEEREREREREREKSTGKRRE